MLHSSLCGRTKNKCGRKLLTFLFFGKADGSTYKVCKRNVRRSHDLIYECIASSLDLVFSTELKVKMPCPIKVISFTAAFDDREVRLNEQSTDALMYSPPELRYTVLINRKRSTTY